MCGTARVWSLPSWWIRRECCTWRCTEHVTEPVSGFTHSHPLCSVTLLAGASSWNVFVSAGIAGSFRTLKLSHAGRPTPQFASGTRGNRRLHYARFPGSEWWEQEGWGWDEWLSACTGPGGLSLTSSVTPLSPRHDGNDGSVSLTRDVGITGSDTTMCHDCRCSMSDEVGDVTSVPARSAQVHGFSSLKLQ